MTEKAITEWIERHLDKKETTDLWDLQAAILTELSKRDSVQYRVRASDSSVTAKLDSISELSGEEKRELLIREVEDHETTHDSEGC
tara:strand:+ start:333 stop:590 length:258 start_codon:yes stop_codon:yes gene_type:complete